MEFFTQLVFFVTFFCQNVNCARFTDGDVEWGTLCKLNTSVFEPENLLSQRLSFMSSRYPSLYHGLHEKNPSADKAPTPCCFPETWESNFVVYTRRIGWKSRGDLSHFRIRRIGDQVESVMVVGQTVLSTLLCDNKNNNTSTLKVCPNDKKECLLTPFLGEPRCVSNATGFHLIPQKNAQNEIWFTDSRIPSGGIKRHIYSFKRQYGLCRLQTYQLLTGQYVDARRNCRLMFLRDQLFVPMTGSFAVNFTYPLDDNLFQCNNL